MLPAAEGMMAEIVPTVTKTAPLQMDAKSPMDGPVPEDMPDVKRIASIQPEWMAHGLSGALECPLPVGGTQVAHR